MQLDQVWCINNLEISKLGNNNQTMEIGNNQTMEIYGGSLAWTD